MTTINQINNAYNTQNIGVKIEKVGIPNENRQIDALVWYPSAPNTCSITYDYNGLAYEETFAVLDAPIKPGFEPYPVIVLSPGIGDCPIGLYSLGEKLAANGYIVVSPEHYGARFCHVTGGSDITAKQLIDATIESKADFAKTVKILLPETLNMTLNNISYRSNETYLTIETAIGWNSDFSSIFFKQINTNKIGIAGQSLGAWDAAHVGGVPMHCENVPESVCEEFPEDFSVEELIPYTCCDPVLQGKTTYSTHPDIDAVLLINPGMIYFPNYLGFEDQGLEETPFMFIMEDLYPKVGMETNGILPYQHLSSDNKYLVEIFSNHLTINRSFDFVMKYLRMGPISASVHNCAENRYYDWSVGFFDAHLKNDHTKLDSLLDKKCDPMIKNKIWED